MNTVQAMQAQRAKRLADLYRWGKAAIPSEELFQTIAFNQLVNRAMGQYSVTEQTATNYATTVLNKLRREAPV